MVDWWSGLVQQRHKKDCKKSWITLAPVCFKLNSPAMHGQTTVALHIFSTSWPEIQKDWQAEDVMKNRKGALKRCSKLQNNPGRWNCCSADDEKIIIIVTVNKPLIASPTMTAVCLLHMIMMKSAWCSTLTGMILYIKLPVLKEGN